MKKPNLFYALFPLGILLISCGWVQSLLPATSEASEVANWDAWSFTWKTADTFADVTVNWTEGDQKTFLPEEPNYLFLAVQCEIINTSYQTQEIRLPQGPMYLTDDQQNVYDLVGLARDDSIFMAPPYLMHSEDTLFSTTKWNDGGFVTTAYQPKPAIWFIQATAGKSFHADFLFTIPANASGLTIHYGDGMLVSIE